jgi:predicted transcriptional regulator
MKNLTVTLDDELDIALEALCAEEGRKRGEFESDVLRRFVERERLAREVQDPAWQAAYLELEQEDIAMAEEGMADYAEGLRQADQSDCL